MCKNSGLTEQYMCLRVYLCVFIEDLCQHCNLSALNHAYCCPCKVKAMSVSFKMRLITEALVYEFN